MSYKTINFTISLPYTVKQCDPALNQKIPGMCDNGCSVCSTAMVLSKLKNSIITAEQVYADNGNSFEMDFPHVVQSHYNLSYERFDGSFDSLKADIFTSIYSYQRPIVVQVPSHFVVVKGFNGNVQVNIEGYPIMSDMTPTMFIVEDPGSSTRTNLQQVMTAYGGGFSSIRKIY